MSHGTGNGQPGANNSLQATAAQLGISVLSGLPTVVAGTECFQAAAPELWR